MTNWILNGQKGDYDWNHNKEYKTCPYCGSDNHQGSFSHGGNWEKKYKCGSIITAEWSNDGYTVRYDIKCETAEGIYNDVDVCGRVPVPGTSISRPQLNEKEIRRRKLKKIKNKLKYN